MVVDVKKRISINSGGTLKRTLRELAVGIIQDKKNLGVTMSFLMGNKEFTSKCMYAESKLIIPFDFEEDSFVLRIEDFSRGLYSKYTIYQRNKDFNTYTKTDYKYNFGTNHWEGKLDNPKVTKLLNYPGVKERIMEDYKIKVRKTTELDLLRKKVRGLYITQLDRRIGDIARDFGMTKETYLGLVGNVSKVVENEYELYRAYQKRVVMDYDSGMSINDIIKEYETSKEPVYRAIKEQCYLLNNKDKFEETILRCYGEGMTINEVNQYFKPISRKFYTKDEFVKLIKEKGHPIKREGKYSTAGSKEAIRLFREGVALEDLVRTVQHNLGRPGGNETYWREFTRYLIGITEGRNGKLDFDTMHKEAKERLNVEREYEIG